jgi:hypothetical protein
MNSLTVKEKTDETIQKWKFRDTDNIRHIRYVTKKKKYNTTQRTKQMTNKDSTKKQKSVLNPGTGQWW